jgi:hypothetical protein
MGILRVNDKRKQLPRPIYWNIHIGIYRKCLAYAVSCNATFAVLTIDDEDIFLKLLRDPVPAYSINI